MQKNTKLSILFLHKAIFFKLQGNKKKTSILHHFQSAQLVNDDNIRINWPQIHKRQDNTKIYIV